MYILGIHLVNVFYWMCVVLPSFSLSRSSYSQNIFCFVTSLFTCAHFFFTLWTMLAPVYIDTVSGSLSRDQVHYEISCGETIPECAMGQLQWLMSFQLFQYCWKKEVQLATVSVPKACLHRQLLEHTLTVTSSSLSYRPNCPTCNHSLLPMEILWPSTRNWSGCLVLMTVTFLCTWGQQGNRSLHPPAFWIDEWSVNFHLSLEVVFIYWAFSGFMFCYALCNQSPAPSYWRNTTFDVEVTFFSLMFAPTQILELFRKKTSLSHTFQYQRFLIQLSNWLLNTIE